MITFNKKSIFVKLLALTLSVLMCTTALAGCSGSKMEPDYVPPQKEDYNFTEDAKGDLVNILTDAAAAASDTESEKSSASVLPMLSGDTKALENYNTLDMSLSAELGDDFYDTLQTIADISGADTYKLEEALALIDWLKKAEIGLNMAYDDAGIALSADAKLNAKEIVKGDIVYTSDDNNAYLGVPTVNSTYIEFPMALAGIDVSDTVAMLDAYQQAASEYTKEIEALMAPAQSILARYLDCATGAISDVTRSDYTLSAGSVSEACYRFDVKLTEEQLYDVAIAILEEAKNDDELKSFIKDFMGAVADYSASIGANADDGAYMYYAISDEIDEALSSSSIQDAIDDLRDELSSASFSDESLPFSIFVNKAGELIGFAMNVDGVDVNIAYTTSGMDDAFLLELTVDGRDYIKLEGAGKINGNKYSGEYKLYADGDEMCTFTYKNNDMTGSEKGEAVDCQISFKLSDTTVSMIAAGDSALSALLSGLEFGIGIVGDTDEAKMSVFANKNGKLLVNIALAAKLSEVKNPIKVPSKSVSATAEADIMSWVQGCNFSKIVDNLKSSGLPKELSSQLDQLASMLPMMLAGGF